MEDFKIIELKESILKDNDKEAKALREKLKTEKVFLLNVMSSPGSGKTTTLVKLISALSGKLNFAVLEADIDSDVDAKTIVACGAKAVQLHTGGMCHLTADMTRTGLDGIDMSGVDVAVIENVGNLVCPAEYDTGASKNLTILSVPEGEDKPLKYPLMYEVCDLLVINKIDALPFFDFNIENCTKNARKINPNIEVIAISAKSKVGIEKLSSWIEKEVKEWREEA